MDQETAFSRYRYHLLFSGWLVVTGAAFLRVSRQLYSTSIKSEQYETIFKGTTLAAALIGIGMNGKFGKRRSTTES